MSARFIALFQEFGTPFLLTLFSITVVFIPLPRILTLVSHFIFWRFEFNFVATHYWLAFALAVIFFCGIYLDTTYPVMTIKKEETKITVVCDVLVHIFTFSFCHECKIRKSVYTRPTPFLWHSAFPYYFSSSSYFFFARYL